MGGVYKKKGEKKNTPKRKARETEEGLLWKRKYGCSSKTLNVGGGEMSVCVFFFLFSSHLVFPFQLCSYYRFAGCLLISQRTECHQLIFFRASG